VSARQGEEVALCFTFDCLRDVVAPAFAVILRNEVRHTIFMPTTALGQGATGRFDAGDSGTVRLRFQNRLAPSRYTLTPCVGPADGGYGRHDEFGRADDLAALVVEGPVTGGVVDLPVEVEVRRT
jgi:hypothetical protein